jgi:hypothetical protein
VSDKKLSSYERGGVVYQEADFNNLEYEPFTVDVTFDSRRVRQVRFYLDGKLVTVDKKAPLRLYW